MDNPESEEQTENETSSDDISKLADEVLEGRWGKRRWKYRLMMNGHDADAVEKEINGR